MSCISKSSMYQFRAVEGMQWHILCQEPQSPMRGGIIDTGAPRQAITHRSIPHSWMYRLSIKPRTRRNALASWHGSFMGWPWTATNLPTSLSARPAALRTCVGVVRQSTAIAPVLNRAAPHTQNRSTQHMNQPLQNERRQPPTLLHMKISFAVGSGVKWAQGSLEHLRMLRVVLPVG